MIINTTMAALMEPPQSVPHSSRLHHDEWVCRRFLPGLALLLLGIAPALASDKPRPAPPVKPAVEYSVNDAHPQEKVSIAADPCDREDDCKFFRLPYVSHGFLPVRVIITNDRDQPLELDEVRIQFFPANGGKEAAATDDDLNRRLFKGKDAVSSKLPIIPIPIHHQPVDQKILNDDTDFGFTSTTIPPHSTRAGYVFYDTRGLDDPVMKHAELYVKQIRSTDEKGAKVELFAFTLPFDKWLAANPPEPAKK
jgi:hypothetical protein